MSALTRTEARLMRVAKRRMCVVKRRMCVVKRLGVCVAKSPASRNARALRLQAERGAAVASRCYSRQLNSASKQA